MWDTEKVIIRMRPPYLTIPVQSSDLDQIERLLRRKLPEVGAIEIWVDRLKKIDRVPERLESLVKRWRSLTDKRLVIVCKDRAEKGRFTGTRQEKVAILVAAAHGGAHYVDIGLHTGKTSIQKLLAQKKRSKLILSHHDFEKTPKPKRLETLAQRMIDLGAEVVKIATMVHQPLDNEALMELAMDLKKRKQRHIILGMGQIGLLTRVFSKPIGNELNFVTLDTKTAPGQVSLEQMKRFYQVFNY